MQRKAKRGFEYSGDRGGGSTAQEDGHVPVGHTHVPGEVGSDGGSGVDDRRLGSDRTSEPDSHGTGGHGRPHVVGTDPGLILGNGLQYLCDSVPDPVLDDESAEEHGKEHSYSGDHDVEGGSQTVGERVGKPFLDPFDKFLQDNSRQTGKNSHDKTHDQEQVVLGDSLEPLADGVSQRTFFPFVLWHVTGLWHIPAKLIFLWIE